MADKTMLNFRCPAELLDAIDALGQDHYPSETAKHGCDRSKTLLDIVRAGIEALSGGAIVLPVSDNIVRHRKTEDALHLDARFAAIEERLGKIEGLSDSLELSKPDVEVAESELHIELGNLQVENEILRADYAKLLESSTHVTNKLQEEVQQLRLQLETERADREKIEAELSQKEQNFASVAARSQKLTPDAATILSQLRARRKKPKTDLQDLEAILEILESSVQ